MRISSPFQPWFYTSYQSIVIVRNIAHCSHYDYGIHYSFVYCFPKRTPEGHRIVCVKTRQFNDDTKVDGMTVANISVSILDALLKVEPMYGNDFLYDLEHLKFSSLLVFTPKLTKRLISIWLVSIQYYIVHI